MGHNTDIIKQGAVGPYHLRFDITGAADFDLTDVTSALFSVRLPDDITVVSWDAQIESVSSTSIRIAYEFQASDLDQLGEYQVVPKLTIPLGGLLFAIERQFTVIPEFKDF